MSAKLFVTDIDNTVFDWVTYYVHAFSALLQRVSSVVGVEIEQLAAESRQVFTEHTSIEYPFVIQELPSVARHYGSDVDKMLEEAVRFGRQDFLAAAADHIRPYAGVKETLVRIKNDFPGMPVVALTDAPRYVAMWKLNKLGLLSCFDAVYGLPDPRIPTCAGSGRVKVDPEILLKHLQQTNFGFTGRIRVLPDDYEKPGRKGLKTVLMDYDLDESANLRSEVLWVGDNLRKDVGLGHLLGVRCAWAAYGTNIDSSLIQKLNMFSPALNVHKNVYLDPKNPDAPSADHILSSFADVYDVLVKF